MTEPTLQSQEAGPDIDFDDDDDNIFEEALPLDEEEIAAVNFEEYARRLGPDLMERDLNIIEGIKEQIPQDVREYIENLRFPKALIGKFKTGTKDHPMLENKGALVSEKEIKLFQYINTILQDPRCIHWRDTHFSDGTQKAYAVHISRYVLFVARNTPLDARDFRIDGVLMKSCFEDLFKTGDSLPLDKGRKVKHTSMNPFRYALTVLHYCLGIVHTGHLGKRERAIQMQKNWANIPLIDVMKTFFEQKQHENYLELKAQYPNKSRSALFQPKYTIKDHRQMMMNMLKKTATGHIKDIYDGIGALVAFSLGHHYLFRGHNMLLLELSDTVYSVEETKHGSVPVLGFQFLKGKTMNVNSKPGLTGACRNKDFLVCPVMAISMSYWYQLDFESQHGPLTGENFPDFMDKTDWYNPKVLFCDSKESRLHSSISSSKLVKLFEMCLDSIGFESTKKAHIGRVTNSLRADACGVSQDQIRRQGRWLLDVLESRYISSYALEFIHYSGGFAADEPYFIPRDVPVPEELQRLIFPWLEDAIEKVQNRVYPSKLPNVERDGSVIRFLNMLKLFRSIIIQDLVLLLDLVPDCIFSKHPIARDPRFLAFKGEVKQAVEKFDKFDATPQIRDAIDILTPSIKLKFDVVKTKLDIIQLRQTESSSAQLLAIERLRDQLPDSLADCLQDRLTDCISKLFTAQNESVKTLMNHTWSAVGHNLSLFVDGGFGDKMVAKIMAETDKAMPHYMDQVLRSFLALTLSDQTTKRRKVKKEPPPHLRGTEFRLLEELVSVSAVWQEWFVSKPGQPSISERNKEYNTRWRHDQEEPYKRRARIINFIARIESELNVESGKAVELLEKYFEDTQCSDMKKLNTSLTHKPLADNAFQAIVEIAHSN